MYSIYRDRNEYTYDTSFPLQDICIYLIIICDHPQDRPTIVEEPPTMTSLSLCVDLGLG
jgi:hypothetical protein